jgi:hypothetical protein
VSTLPLMLHSFTVLPTWVKITSTLVVLALKSLLLLLACSNACLMDTTSAIILLRLLLHSSA